MTPIDGFKIVIENGPTPEGDLLSNLLGFADSEENTVALSLASGVGWIFEH